MSGFEKLKVCTHYRYKGKQIDYMPYDVVHETLEPVYEILEGWSQNLEQVSDLDELPTALHDYVAYIERVTGLPITIISVGPDRKQTLLRQAVLR